MKYIFKQIDNISGHNAETTVEFSAEYLPDILQHFEMFLRGSGYHPSGTLEFVDYEDPYTTPKFECAEEDYEDEDLECAEEDLEEEYEEEWTFSSQSTNTDEGSAVMDWTAAQLIRPPKMEDICPVCKIDMKTMLNHECWDKNCPKGKDAN